MIVQDAIATGPVFGLIDAALRELPVYEAFRAGRLSHADFCAFVDGEAARLLARGVPEGDLPFVKRLPPSPAEKVAETLSELADRGLIPEAAFDAARAASAATILESYDHGPFKTYIYPEEGLLLFALADLLRPRHALFLGSYYGYWAHWAIGPVAEGGGRLTLVDPSLHGCAVACANIISRAASGRASVVAARGEDFLAQTDELFDLVVLDAENPRDHPDPEQRGKRVYHSLLRACLPRLARDAVLVCHNILFADETGDPAFRRIIARNVDELGPFMRLVEERFDFIEIKTTEGVGVGRRRARPRDERRE